MLKFIRLYRVNFFVIIVFFLVFAIFSLHFFRKEMTISGETMGTTYNIKVISNLFYSKQSLHDLINSRLIELNSSLSTYDSKSEISQFNSIKKLEDKFYPSHDFLNLLFISRKLHELTGYVWDPTIDPIVNAWGFGREGRKSTILEADKLKKLLSNVDFKKAILFCDDGSIQKGFIDASIDLASIAKGFGVDQIALLLVKEGFKNFLVEIGGEVYAKGFRKDGMCWRVGISYPEKNITISSKLYKVLSISNRAIATSGDYRNFVQIDGKNYSHIIDPRTGYPITNSVTSVSVIAENCTIADGLATAFMVFNPNDSIALVNKLPSVECIIMTLDNDKSLKSYSSNGI